MSTCLLFILSTHKPNYYSEIIKVNMYLERATRIELGRWICVLYKYYSEGERERERTSHHHPICIYIYIYIYEFNHLTCAILCIAVTFFYVVRALAYINIIYFYNFFDSICWNFTHCFFFLNLFYYAFSFSSSTSYTLIFSYLLAVSS
jgi:hypothetical protein